MDLNFSATSGNYIPNNGGVRYSANMSNSGVSLSRYENNHQPPTVSFVGGWLELSPFPVPTPPFSIAMNIRNTGYYCQGPDYCVLFGTNGHVQIVQYPGFNSYGFIMYNGGQLRRQCNFELVPQTYGFLVCVVTAQRNLVYLNGQLVCSSEGQAGTESIFNKPVYIGSPASDPKLDSKNNWHGEIRSIQIYDRVVVGAVSKFLV